MIMDSLRYWVTEMHVDGFRFDLAATLARELHDVSKLSSFFDTIHQDPTLADVKLIAEPWDVGEGGYQVGQFPVLWAEWNGKVSRHGAALLEGRRGTALGLCLSADRIERSVPVRWTQAVREHQFCDRARRIHAVRPGELQPEAQRSQRRRQQGRERQQRLVEHGRGRARPTILRSTSCASGRCGIFWRR